METFAVELTNVRNGEIILEKVMHTDALGHRQGYLQVFSRITLTLLQLTAGTKKELYSRCTKSYWNERGSDI